MEQLWNNLTKKNTKYIDIKENTLIEDQNYQRYTFIES